jgi:hypothetical protein
MMRGYPVAAFDRERALGPFLPVIACLMACLLVWGLLRVGAKRPTASWAWALVLLFAALLVADLLSMRGTNTNANDTFSTAPQKTERK